jgi:HTH-type transcriptional regulator/antitoxin HigA
MIRLIALQFNLFDMANIKKIVSSANYKSVMQKIDTLMAKGSKNVSKTELAEIRKLALLAEKYERSKHTIDVPTTLAGIIEMKMYEMRLKQKDLAHKLHVSDTKLSLIISGKQKPDVDFLKAIYNELHVDADLLLKAV